MAHAKIPIYLIPGMAASPLMFNRLHFSEEQFQVQHLEWFMPTTGMSLATYAQKMCEKVRHVQPVLIGVSFGGLLAQEMAKCMEVKKVIGISTVKSKRELPKRMLWAKYTKAHKLLPTGLSNHFDYLPKHGFGQAVSRRLQLYQHYWAIKDKRYLDWAIDQIVGFDQLMPPPHFIHIHGTKDAVFPINNIQNCIAVENGTHAMIIYKAHWFNEHLPRLISSCK